MIFGTTGVYVCMYVLGCLSKQQQQQQQLEPKERKGEGGGVQ